MGSTHEFAQAMQWDGLRVEIINTDENRRPDNSAVVTFDCAVDAGDIEAAVEVIRQRHYDQNGPPNHHFRRSEHFTEWGASGASLELAIEVASWTFPTMAAFAAKLLFERFAQGRREAYPEEEAAEKARYSIAYRYGIEADHLKLLGQQSSSEQNIVKFQDSRRIYTITLSRGKNNIVSMEWAQWEFRQ